MALFGGGEQEAVYEGARFIWSFLQGSEETGEEVPNVPALSDSGLGMIADVSSFLKACSTRWSPRRRDMLPHVQDVHMRVAPC